MARELCTKSKIGRSIHREIALDFLARIDVKSKADFAKYRQRQMIFEHFFCTSKRWRDGCYILTSGLGHVSTETAPAYTASNLKRVINILGAEEMVRRLEDKGKPVLASAPV